MSSMLSPDSRESLAAALRDHDARRLPVALRGAGTHSVAPEADRTVIDLQLLRGVIAYEPEDLTITVRAGTPWHALQDLLAADGQWLPVEPAVDATSTVGGIVAGGLSGASRLRYGPLRDHLIAATYVTPDGTIARSGSGVVKSVAGYDVHKLIAGSRGTLCAIADVTFKVAPRPEAQSMLTLPLRATSVDELARLISSAAPAYVVVMSARLVREASCGDETTVVIRWDGYDRDVDTAVQAASTLGTIARRGDRAFADWNNLVTQWNLGRKSIVRVTNQSSELVPMFMRLTDGTAAGLDLASGVLDVDLRTGSFAADTQSVEAMLLYALGRAPGLFRGPSTVERRLATTMKTTFDPHNILEQWHFYD